MSDVDIVLGIAVSGVEKVYNLSNAMQQLNRAVQGATNPMKNLDARSRALSAAIGSSDSSLKNHAKSVSELARNNAVLTNEMNRVRKEISGLGTSYKFATGASAEFRRAAVSDLKAYEASLKGIRVRALVEDLKSLSQEQKRLGKDAQFVGRSLIIGLTTPIMGFGRVGLQTLVAIDREFVRLNKVLESVAPNLDAAAKKMGVDLASATREQNVQLDKMVASYQALDKQLSTTSTKFGLAKSLTVGLAGDFAELGIQTTDNIALITELTAKTEKLGNMDIGAAKDLVQSLYFQAQRAIQEQEASKGPGQKRLSFSERETAAIKAATAQLNLFNSVENVTALTLKDLGDAFPEVAAAATSFGLSMTEAGALLAPMKAAGFEVGASANSIKVSLQRLTAPTKQNAELFKQLSKEYNTNFNLVKGTGLDAIQNLVDGFNEIKKSAAGQEGAMEFFSKVFGVRQGPRMEVAIAQLAAFDAILKDQTIPTTISAEKKLQDFANTAVTSANKAGKANLPLVNSFRDIGIIARIATATAGQQIEGLAEKVTAEQIKAAKEVRKELSKEILKAQREGGEDLIGQVGTEAGRAMFIQLAGAANASQIAQRELEAALGSLDTQLSILKNNFKTFAADLLTNIKPTVEKLVEISTKLYNAWANLDDQTKKLISTTALVVAGLTAAIGPLIFVFGQFRLAMGSVGKVLFGFIPGLKTMSVEALAGRDAMLRLTKPLQAVGDTVVNTNGKFATFIATLASGQGPVAKMAEKLGTMSGVLQKQTTAPIGLTREVMSQKVSRGLLPGVAGAEAIEYVGGPAATRRLRRTAGGIIDAEDPTLRVSRAARKAFAEEEFAMEQMGLRRGGASGTRYNIQQRAGILRRTMGYRSISGEDVGSAINLRQRAFEAAGIERTSTSSSLGGGILRRGGREISEERALGIARGGVRGRILGAIDTAGAKSDAAMGAIRALPSKAVTSYTGALSAAKAAQKALTIETLAFTGTGPSKFAQMRAGVMGFAKSFGLVNNAIKLTKITLIASGIGVIILSIGVAVMLVMKNMDKFKQAGASGFGTLKKIFGTLKQTIESLARPFIDLFSSFGNGAKDSEGAVQGLGNAFNALTKVLEFVANMFKWLVENIIQPYLYGVVNLVKFVVNIFQGKWSDALKALAGAFANVFGGIAKLGIEVIAFLIKQIINILFELPSAFMKAWAWGIEKATDLFFGFVEWVLGQVKRIPVLGRFLGGVGDAALGGLKSARDTYLSTVRTVANAVNAGGDVIKRGIDSVADKAKGAVDKISKIGVKKSKGKLDLFGGKDENSVEVDTDDAQEAITSSVGSGFDEGAQEGAEKLVSRIKEIKKELQQEIADRIKDTMKNVVDILQETLKKQKEDALTVYDNQIKSIEAVGKAEQKLTREQEYQNKLREAELERSINRTNSRRSYAMAIYAGQIDEARNIADAAARQEVQDNENINQINQDRIREVAEENRNELIQSIKDAKDTSSKYFDSMITLFTDAAKKITEFPPTTAEEFNTMLNNLIEGGNGFIGAKAIANSMGQTFSDSFRGALSSLGVNATGPLTSSLAAISKTLTDNNPFGPTGVWNKTIDESINALTRKYQGLTNTLTTIIDTKSAAFQKLYDIYNKYQNLVGTTGAGSNNKSPGTGGGSTTKPGYNNDGVKDGNKVSIATANADLGKIKQYSDKYLSDKYGGTAEGKKLVTSIKSIVSSIASSAVLLGGHDEGMKDFFPVVAANRYKDQITTNSELVYAYIVNNRRLFTKGAGAQARTDESGRSGFFKGGMPYAMGGPTKGPIQQGIPAILHGGEYVVRNSAVKKYGWGMMQQINQGTYKPKPFAVGGIVPKPARELDLRENTDPAYREWLWQQENGGLGYKMLWAIAKKESGKEKTTKGLPNWTDIAGMRKSDDPSKPKDKLSGGFNMPISLWGALGGKQFAEAPGLASALAQMVINNRYHIFGWKTANGQLIPPKLLFDHVYPRQGRGAEGYQYIQLPELFDPSKSYEKNLIQDIVGKSKKSVQRQFLKENPQIAGPDFAGGFATTQGKNDYLQYLNQYMSSKKGKWPFRIRMPFSSSAEWYRALPGRLVVNGFIKQEFAEQIPTPEGFAIGGLVKGKKKLSSVADFRKFDQEGIYKYNYQAMMDQTSARIKAMKESGYNVANQRKVLNPFSDLAYKPENAKASLWDKTLGKVVTGVANTAKIGISSFLSGVSFAPEFAVALGSTLLGKAGIGESQAKGSLFNQLIASPFMQTSLGQTLKAAKEMVTTGKDYRELMGLDRGPFGLAGFIPMSASERAMKEASQNRSILGKGTILSPGGLLAYYGLDKTGIAKEGSGAYMATNMGGDMLALLGLDPAVGISGIKSGLSKFKPSNVSATVNKIRNSSNLYSAKELLTRKKYQVPKGPGSLELEKISAPAYWYKQAKNWQAQLNDLTPVPTLDDSSGAGMIGVYERLLANRNAVQKIAASLYGKGAINEYGNSAFITRTRFSPKEFIKYPFMRFANTKLMYNLSKKYPNLDRNYRAWIDYNFDPFGTSKKYWEMYSPNSPENPFQAEYPTNLIRKIAGKYETRFKLKPSLGPENPENVSRNTITNNFKDLFKYIKSGGEVKRDWWQQEYANWAYPERVEGYQTTVQKIFGELYNKKVMRGPGGRLFPSSSFYGFGRTSEDFSKMKIEYLKEYISGPAYAKKLMRQKVLANIKKSQMARGNFGGEIPIDKRFLMTWEEFVQRRRAATGGSTDPMSPYLPSTQEYLDYITQGIRGKYSNTQWRRIWEESGRQFVGQTPYPMDLGSEYFYDRINTSFGGMQMGTTSNPLIGNFGGAFDLATAINRFGIPIDDQSVLFRGLRRLSLEIPWVRDLVGGRLTKGSVIPHIGAVRTTGSTTGAAGFFSPVEHLSALLALKPEKGAKSAFTMGFAGEQEALLAGLKELVLTAEPVLLRSGTDRATYFIAAKLREIISRDNFTFDNLTRISGSLGGNEGGIYQAQSGVQFYIKRAKSLAVAKNEEMAAKLYDALGIETAHQRVVRTKEGVPYVVSQIIENLTPLTGQIDPIALARIQEDIATHAWLGNYDVIGRNFDNLQLAPGGFPVVVDPGASLFFRGTGKIKKGSEWEFGDDAVGLLQDLVANPNNKVHEYIRNAKSIFGEDMDFYGIRQSVLKLINRFHDQQNLDNFVKAVYSVYPGPFYPGGPSKAEETLRVLYMRLKSLQQSYAPHAPIPTLDNFLFGYNRSRALPQNYIPEEYNVPQAFLKSIPVDEVFNGGLIRGYETGGLVKGQKNTKTPSAADFRKFESKYSNWDLQSITYIAQQKLKDSKKNIFQKGLSSISGFFKKKGQEALYGSGNGFFAGLKSAQQLDSGQTEFSPRDPLSNPAYRTGFAYSKAASEMLLPYVGGAFSATRAMDKNRSTGDRSLNALFAGLGLIGPTTVFAPNSGYLTMPSKIKTLKNLDKLTDVATLRNVDQFFPGTRIPMPAGLIPTFSQEQGQILNQIGASAVSGRRPPLGPYQWKARYPRYRDENLSVIRNNLIDSLKTKAIANPNSDLARYIANVTSKINPLEDRLPSLLTAPYFKFDDLMKLVPESYRSEDALIRLIKDSNLGHSADWIKAKSYTYPNLEKMLDHIKSGKIGEATREFTRENVMANIRESRAIRNATKSSRDIFFKDVFAKYPNVPRSIISKALKDQTKMFVNAADSGSYESYSVEMWRQIADDMFGHSVKFRFKIGQPLSIWGQGYGLIVDYLEKGNNVQSSSDLLDVMAYVHEAILKPKGIKDIFPGSTSPHSFILAHKMNEVFKVLDPDMKIHIPSVAEYMAPGSSGNTIDFDSWRDSPWMWEKTGAQLASSFDTAPDRDAFNSIDTRISIAMARRQIAEAMRAARRANRIATDQQGVPLPSKQELFDYLRNGPTSSPIPRIPPVPPTGNFNGGLIRGFANGGFVSAFASQGVPAMLHGGEYVINSSAVKNLGLSALEALNQMRFNAPKSPSYSGPVQPQSSSTSTVHIYVDNFIGEKAWFESMMKDYNINVAPQNQKAAGLNNTTISTYRGINRGL
jgi:TP901 family phage tail tape measure protein